MSDNTKTETDLDKLAHRLTLLAPSDGVRDASEYFQIAVDLAAAAVQRTADKALMEKMAEVLGTISRPTYGTEQTATAEENWHIVQGHLNYFSRIAHEVLAAYEARKS